MFTERLDRITQCISGVARGISPALLLLATASPARAQDAVAEADSNTAPNNDAIIVEGMKRSELKKAIGGYVRTLTELSPTSPLARYQPDIYCPMVFGFSDVRNKQIADRMRRVAEAAGVKPAPHGCTTSALVFFVDDKQSFLDAFKKQQPDYFKDPKGELWSPPAESGPVMSWQLTQQIDVEGRPLEQDAETGIRTVSSPQGGSRLLSMFSLAVAMSVVIIERKALIGLSPTQIADYALMRGLTDSSPKNLKGAEQFSILGVMDTPMNSATHASLTQWDLAYIEGRYKGDARSYGQRQGAAIRQNIERAVTGKDEE